MILYIRSGLIIKVLYRIVALIILYNIKILMITPGKPKVARNTFRSLLISTALSPGTDIALATSVDILSANSATFFYIDGTLMDDYSPDYLL